MFLDLGLGALSPSSFFLIKLSFLIPSTSLLFSLFLSWIQSGPFCSWPCAFWAKGKGVEEETVDFLEGAGDDAVELPVLDTFKLNNLSLVKVTVSILDAAS